MPKLIRPPTKSRSPPFLRPSTCQLFCFTLGRKIHLPFIWCKCSVEKTVFSAPQIIAGEKKQAMTCQCLHLDAGLGGQALLRHCHSHAGNGPHRNRCLISNPLPRQLVRFVSGTYLFPPQVKTLTLPSSETIFCFPLSVYYRTLLGSPPQINVFLLAVNQSHRSRNSVHAQAKPSESLDC